MTTVSCGRCGRMVMIQHAKIVNGRTYGYKCAKKVKASLETPAIAPADDRIAQLEEQVRQLTKTVIILKDQVATGKQVVWEKLPTIPNGDNIPISNNTDYANCVNELKTVLAERGILN